MTYANSAAGDRVLSFVDGELVVRHDAGRVLLLDERGEIADVRSLREDEMVRGGNCFSFPSHLVRVPLRPEIDTPVEAPLCVTIRGYQPPAQLSWGYSLITPRW